MNIQEAIDAGFTHLATYKDPYKKYGHLTAMPFFVEYNPETGDYLSHQGTTCLVDPEHNFIIEKLTNLLEKSK